VSYKGETSEYDEDAQAGQIDRALAELDEVLHMLASLVEEAHQRLAPALRPEEPSLGPVDDRETKLAAIGRQHSPLADRIIALRSRTHTLLGSFRELLARVDL
jgi:hypothetical protein